MARRCCCSDCESKVYDSVAKWTAVGDGTITADGNVVVDGFSAPKFNVDGEVNPATFITGKEAWKIRWWMKGQAIFTIDGIAYTIDTDAQTIDVDGVTDSIGQFERHLPSDELFLFELRVTPSHAYLIGYGNYVLDDDGTLTGGPKNAFAILTVDRVSDAPNSFTIEWTDATIANFRIDESTVTVTATYVPTYSRLCWIRPPAICPYFMVKRMSRDHLYQDDPAHLQDYAMPDLAATGWDIWAWLVPGCASPVPTWATGTVLKCPPTDVAPNPADPLHTHGVGDFCGFSGTWSRWTDLGGGSYGCAYTTGLSGGVYVYGGTLTLLWPTPTYAQPYPKPFYRATLFTSYGISVRCCYNGSQYRCAANITTGGSVEATIACNSLKSGFTLSVAGSVTVDVLYDLDDGTCSAFANPLTCDYEYDITFAGIAALLGAVGATWTV